MWSRFVMSQVKHNSYFIAGVALGLWVSLAVIPLEEDVEPVPCAAAVAAAAAAAVDEFEPHREDKPLGSGGQTAGRAVQRPRYYSTELGMRGSLLTGVLSSEEALKSQVGALNHTLAQLQPALKFFITASAMSSVPGLANVVGFTDTREMLKPFHALKYLADNYLEEYDFFFLVTDTSFVNARRLTELVAKLSVSQDIYMGIPDDGESQYCSLESGIILSNSVLRAVHGELEWCVRNSYSPHHHENLGRCVLHAAHRACTTHAQGESYEWMDMSGGGPAGALVPRLADAVTGGPVRGAPHLYTLHAYVARIYLERDSAEVRQLRGYMWRNSWRHPPHYRNATWCGGQRADPGLARPPPDNRFSHLRWTLFNDTHAYMPDDVRAVAELDAGHRAAVQQVWQHASAWAARAWGGAVRLVEGAWQWEPAVGLRYRLLVRPHEGPLRLLELMRTLGAARLVPVRYVTESARVSLVVAVPHARPALDDVRAALDTYQATGLVQDKNTDLYVVSVSTSDNSTREQEAALRAAVSALAARHPAATVELLSASVPLSAGGTPPAALAAAAAGAALSAAAARAPDGLLLVVPPHLEYNQDFLNRVRMNTIAGSQWFLPVPFSRHSHYMHPRVGGTGGTQPAAHTGRFNTRTHAVLAVHAATWLKALSAWRGEVSEPAAVLAASALRCIRAPEPGAVLAPRPAPCSPSPSPCLAALRDAGVAALDLGARSKLAHLLLETQAEQA